MNQKRKFVYTFLKNKRIKKISKEIRIVSFESEEYVQSCEKTRIKTRLREISK